MSKPIKNLQLFNDLCATEETLIERGWCKNRPNNINGAVCLMKAASEVVDCSGDYYLRLYAVEKALESVIGRNPVCFNDDPTTTFDDVLTKLREAREKLL